MSSRGKIKRMRKTELKKKKFKWRFNYTQVINCNSLGVALSYDKGYKQNSIIFSLGLVFYGIELDFSRFEYRG